jgi:hypothetical protein
MIDQFLPLFRSDKFNICCDETFDLQNGKHKDKDIGKLYVDFVNQLIAYLKNQSKQVMMWGDVILQHMDYVQEIPKDTVFLNWFYGADKNEAEEIATLRSQIDQLAKILEKVVDDVYEEEGIAEAKDAEGNEHEIIKSENKDSEHPYRLEHKINGKTVSVSSNDFPADVKKEEEHIKKSYGIKEDKKELRKAAIPAFLKIVAESNISEEALSEIIDMIKGDLK